MFGDIVEIQRKFRDQYGFKPTGGTDAYPLFADGVIPDGEYRMKIRKVKLLVKVKNNKLSITAE